MTDVKSVNTKTFNLYRFPKSYVIVKSFDSGYPKQNHVKGRTKKLCSFKFFKLDIALLIKIDTCS